MLADGGDCMSDLAVHRNESGVRDGGVGSNGVADADGYAARRLHRGGVARAAA